MTEKESLLSRLLEEKKITFEEMLILQERTVVPITSEPYFPIVPMYPTPFYPNYPSTSPYWEIPPYWQVTY